MEGGQGLGATRKKRMDVGDSCTILSSDPRTR